MGLEISDLQKAICEGNVVGIRRSDQSTVVIVDEGINQIEYHLEERLIQFGTAIYNQHIDK